MFRALAALGGAWRVVALDASYIRIRMTRMLLGPWPVVKLVKDHMILN